MENTKGPWKVMFDAEHISIVECVGHPRTIGEAFISKNRLEKDEAMANAKLMAAAPDLLAACIEFVRKVECGEARSVRSYAQMKEAISKATGAN